MSPGGQNGVAVRRFCAGKLVGRAPAAGGGSGLHFEEVLQDLLAGRMLFVEEFGMKLHTKQGSLLMFHRLDGTGRVGGGAPETFGQRLYLVTVGMPNSYLRRQVLEDALAIDFYREVAAFALGAFITFARLKPFHQVYGGTKCQGHLLMPATNSEHGLRRFLDYFK